MTLAGPLACGPAGEGGGHAPGAASGNRTGADLTGAGATFPYPIYARWFDAYAKQIGVRINFQAIGSGGGIRQFTEGTIDFGATDSPMTDAQVAAVHGNVRHLPTVLGAVVLTYNLPSLGATRLRLDGPVIAAIFQGEITRWNDPHIGSLNPGVTLPTTDVLVIHRSDGSGTSFIFTDYLAKVSPRWATSVGRSTSVDWPIGLGGKGNEGVTQQVKQLEGAVGYVELIYAQSNHLPVATVRNRAGNFVEPTLKSVTAAAASAHLGSDTDFRVSITNAPGADSYPISSFTWLLVRPTPVDTAKARKLDGFLAWMLTPEAQQMALAIGYAPLPTDVIALERRRITVP
ncbi:MAG TPA: phosphate ABC transporter substrate-binding protein PstS [Gemmatimonadales bacterium]|nr:phosphate ABC transporter substrate-binding protein PstS [Gemmatimonadales bacterium]